MHHQHAEQTLNRLALSATTHCLTGCAIGEVLGVVIGTALGWGNWETIALAIVLAFFFGYSFTSWPYCGLVWRSARSSQSPPGQPLPDRPWVRARRRARASHAPLVAVGLIIATSSW